MTALMWLSRLLALAFVAGMGTVLIMGPVLMFWLLMVGLVAAAVVEHTAHSILQERKERAYREWVRRTQIRVRRG